MWGGEVGLRKSTFQLYRDGFKIHMRIAGVDGQGRRFLAVQDVRIDEFFRRHNFFERGRSMGLFQWPRDVDPSPDAWLSSKSNGALLKGLKGSSEYERMKMTEEAM